MTYLAGVARADPPKPKVCITQAGDIIIVSGNWQLFIKQVPCAGQPPPGTICFNLTISCNIGLPGGAHATLKWDPSGGPTDFFPPGQLTWQHQTTKPQTVYVTASLPDGTILVSLYAGE